MIQIIKSSLKNQKFWNFIISKKQTRDQSKRWRSIDSKIPSPTWSIKDLNLTRNNENDESNIISDEELSILSKRCLIDTASMDETERHRLKVELGNMMRCISMVTTFEFDGGLDKEALEELMYDVPRGFSSKRSCPVRMDDTVDVNSWEEKGIMEETKYIVNHLKAQGKLVQNKEVMTDDDNYWYFANPSSK